MSVLPTRQKDPMSLDDAPELDLPAFDARQSLREQVAQALRGAIITGRMRTGVVYSAPALAVQFGVSATPVREAMLDLAGEGLVASVRNKGFRVTEPTDRELDEITALRALIEVPTVRYIAASGLDADVLEQLGTLATAIERAAADRDLITYVTADTRFHLRLLAESGNTHLVDTVRTLRARTRLYGLRELAAHGRLVPSGHEHTELLSLIADHDAAGAEELMRRHIDHVRTLWADNAPQA